MRLRFSICQKLLAFHPYISIELEQNMIRVFIFILALFAASSAVAQTRHALLIGIDEYEHFPNYGSSAFAVSDVRALSTVLESAGLHVTQALNTTHDELDAILDDFTAHISPGDEVLIYAAGKGGHFRREQLLLLRDAPEPSTTEALASAVAQSLHIRSFAERLSGAGANAVAMIVDTCRTTIRRRGVPMPANADELMARPAGSAALYFYSAARNDCPTGRLGPLDRSTNSVFMRNLLPPLIVPGRSLQDAFKHARNAVFDQTADTLGKPQVLSSDGTREAPAFLIMPPVFFR